MSFVTTIAVPLALVISGGTWINYRRQRWNRDMAKLERELFLNPQDVPQASYESLPAVVQRYFQKVLPPNPTAIHSARFSQTGLFQLNGKWVPFTADQTMSTNPPGFVWDARIQMTKWITVQVCDAWSQGHGILRAWLLGAYSLVPAPSNPEQEHHLIMGEGLRWLAEASGLCPTALLLSSNITWTSTSDTKATVTLKDPFTPNTTTPMELTLTFDTDGLVRKVNCMRPAVNEKDHTVSLKPWEGHFDKYREIGGVHIPEYMECGWFVQGQLELYFKGTNHNVVFEYDENILPDLKSEEKDATKVKRH